MDWRHHSIINVPIDVPARSMLIMRDEARYDWQHGIQARTWDPVIEYRTLKETRRIKVVTSDTIDRQTRISLTFRWTRTGNCECSYKTLCDISHKTTNDLDDTVASNLEELHVHQVYEQISRHFSTTRHQVWPKVVDFLREVPIGSVLIDLGAGNGKNILKRNDILQIAGERSNGLLNECKSFIGDLPAADCVRLDLLLVGIKDRCADVIICIAVIHHFSSQTSTGSSNNCSITTFRGTCPHHGVGERPNQIKLSVQKKERMINNNSTIEVAGVNLPVHENRTQFQHKDLLVPWKLRGVKENKLADKPDSTLLRFYHVFEEGELEELCVLSDLVVENSFYDEGNWCVICKKI